MLTKVSVAGLVIWTVSRTCRYHAERGRTGQPMTRFRSFRRVPSNSWNNSIVLLHVIHGIRQSISIPIHETQHFVARRTSVVGQWCVTWDKSAAVGWQTSVWRLVAGVRSISQPGPNFAPGPQFAGNPSPHLPTNCKRFHFPP
jgi:hypothetical protein